MAPFTPFIAEEIYKNLTGNESVHLRYFPKADERLIDEKLNEEMDVARNIIREGLQLRAKAGIKVRQPLSKFSIFSAESEPRQGGGNFQFSNDIIEIIKDELNVKEVIEDREKEDEMALDTEITEDLKLEGQAREIIRHIQEMRKEAGYEVDNRIVVSFEGMKDLFAKLDLRKMIEKEVLATKLSDEKMEHFDLEKEFKINREDLKIRISK